VRFHGLAQRGGSIIVHVRIADQHTPISPLVPKGNAHLLVGLELLETIRYIEYANNNSWIIANRRLLPPPIPKIEIPKLEDIEKLLKGISGKVLFLNQMN